MARDRTTSRTKFQDLAHRRIREAKALYDAQCYDGAYYLAGYAVECALKAAICRKFQRHTLADKKAVDSAYSHELAKLLAQAELSKELAVAETLDPNLALNWLVIRDWTPESRYQRNSKLIARDLIRAIEYGPSSFIYWVISKW